MTDTAIINKPVLIKQDTSDNTKPAVCRKTYLDVMRIAASFFVIVNHTNSDVFLKLCEPQSFAWYFSLAYFYISKIAVPIFFMIMGGLLLQKIDSPKKSFQRVLRMITVTVIFSLVYYVKTNWHNPENMSISEFLEKITTSRTANAYWYIYAYIGLLILLPLLQRMAQAFSKNATLYFVILSMGVLGILPLIKVFFKLKLNHYVTDVFFPVHLGVIFMGYYIEKYMNISKKAFIISLSSFTFLIAFQIVATSVFYNKNHSSYLYLDNWQYITITLTATCFYIVCKYLSTITTQNEVRVKVLTYLGSLTFGIYLLSDLMISLTRKMYAQLQNETSIIIATIVWELLIFALCGVTTAVLKLIPGLKKLL